VNFLFFSAFIQNARIVGIQDVNDSLETWTLLIRKEWITNSRNADIFAVSARIEEKH
jgi:alkylation response protein AidB-like acyl-CoA dehydrogenase